MRESKESSQESSRESSRERLASAPLDDSSARIDNPKRQRHPRLEGSPESWRGCPTWKPTENLSVATLIPGIVQRIPRNVKGNPNRRGKFNFPDEKKKEETNKQTKKKKEGQLAGRTRLRRSESRRNLARIAARIRRPRLFNAAGYRSRGAGAGSFHWPRPRVPLHVAYRQSIGGAADADADADDDTRPVAQRPSPSQPDVSKTTDWLVRLKIERWNAQWRCGADGFSFVSPLQSSDLVLVFCWFFFIVKLRIASRARKN